MIERFRAVIGAAYQREPSELLYAIAKHHASFLYVCAYTPTYQTLTRILYSNSKPATERAGMIVQSYRDDAAYQFAATLLAQDIQLLRGDFADAFALFMIDPAPSIFEFIKLAGMHLQTTVGADAAAWDAAEASYAADTLDPAWDCASREQRGDLFSKLMRGDAQLSC